MPTLFGGQHIHSQDTPGVVASATICRSAPATSDAVMLGRSVTAPKRKSARAMQFPRRITFTICGGAVYCAERPYSSLPEDHSSVGQRLDHELPELDVPGMGLQADVS
jgi:hypothetical protein